ncbi:MAG: tetratricopeptide repeat protein [Nitrospiraceae bacterium]|nr:tetratricopeptide repeat protein [Nitrospiraceae bacterium]
MKRIIVVAMLLVMAAGCRQKEEPRPQYQVPAGGDMHTQEEMRLLKEAVKKDPGNVNAWIKIGNSMMDASRFSEAIDAYRKALQLDEKNVDVRVDLGTCYRDMGKPDEAVKEYRKALEINPGHLNGHKNLGVVLAYDLRDKAAAIKEFERYLELAPSAPDAATVRQEIQNLKAAK